ncbi:hypothetical protein GCM10020331_000290 [Ectobacillus funiculus]
MLFGVATLENAFDKVAVVDVMDPTEIVEKKKLICKSRQRSYCRSSILDN